MFGRHVTHGPAAVLRVFCWVLLSGTLSLPAQGQYSLDLGREAGLFGAGFAFQGVSLLQARRPFPVYTAPLDASAVGRLDRVALGRWDQGAHRTSNVLLGAAVVASFTASILVQDGDDAFVPVVILLETGLLTSGMTNVMKETIRRPRPYLYDPGIPANLHRGHDDHHSFWSGHTATAAAMSFATAQLVQRSDASAGVRTATWVGAVSIPAAMGFLRVRAGRHFPTDVFVGYAFGALVGWAVPYIHRNSHAPNSP